MFCIQCEQTINTPDLHGCVFRGNCGKTPETSDLQDLLVAMIESLSAWAMTAKAAGADVTKAAVFVPKAFFSTLTNVNFDPARITAYIREAEALRDELAATCAAAGSAKPDHPLADLTVKGLCAKGLDDAAKAVKLNADGVDADIEGLQLLCLYGLKGAAAYLEHAAVLGVRNEDVEAKLMETLADIGRRSNDAAKLLDTALSIGRLNFEIMEMLERANTTAYGHPFPAQVRASAVKGKAILVSGHDLRDLRLILEQTEGKGINVYTNGELLPAHAYPELRRFKHLVGNYGSAWHNQQTEFAAFPGPIVMTTNCILDPNPGKYADRIYTRSMVGWPGCTHLVTDDFSPVIEQALAMPGFTADEPERTVSTGFGRQILEGAADTVLKLVGEKKLRHVFLVGGCDGARSSRSYYTEFVEKVPADCLMLTLACGKYRFNGKSYGNVGGLPRLLDVGQCNDAYAAIRLAVLLAEKAGCGVNDLPLTLVLSWFEQKAIAILLTLLALGVKGIYIGPTLPAFLTPNLINTLVSAYDLHVISTPDEDLKAILG